MLTRIIGKSNTKLGLIRPIFIALVDYYDYEE